MMPDSGKRADIHIKLSRDNAKAAQERLISRFAENGFYRVVTWAGNEVCTGQFRSPALAHNVYRTLASFFDANGGASEMTLELAPKLWRNSWKIEDRVIYSAMPPVIGSEKAWPSLVG